MEDVTEFVTQLMSLDFIQSQNLSLKSLTSIQTQAENKQQQPQAQQKIHSTNQISLTNAISHQATLIYHQAMITYHLQMTSQEIYKPPYNFVQFLVEDKIREK